MAKSEKEPNGVNVKNSFRINSGGDLFVDGKEIGNVEDTECASEYFSMIIWMWDTLRQLIEDIGWPSSVNPYAEWERDKTFNIELRILVSHYADPEADLETIPESSAGREITPGKPLTLQERLRLRGLVFRLKNILSKEGWDVTGAFNDPEDTDMTDFGVNLIRPEAPEEDWKNPAPEGWQAIPPIEPIFKRLVERIREIRDALGIPKKYLDL